MKNYIVILFFISGSVFSQNLKTIEKFALRDAKAATKAAVDRNLKTILKHTHPKIYKTFGQRQLTDTMKEIFDTMDAKNIKILISKVDEISDIKQENKEFHCLARITTEMDFNGNLITLKSSLFGFYNNKKSLWCFVESNKLLEDPDTQKLFPKFKTEIKIPLDQYIPNN